MLVLVVGLQVDIGGDIGGVVGCGCRWRMSVVEIFEVMLVVDVVGGGCCWR